MKIVHELNQLDFGGVEKIIRSIIKHDKVNEHTVLAYKPGPFKSKLEEVGAKVILMPEDDLDLEADVIHTHCGGGRSRLADHLAGDFVIIETIHSPVRSPMGSDIITQRIGVSDAVSRMNDRCATILNGLEYDEIEPTRFRDEVREELGIHPSQIVIGRLGRVGRDKGLEDWLLMCGELQARGYDIVPLVVGGEARGCDGYIGKLKLMAECLPVKNVVWTGHHDDIGNYLQCMDVFLYPSPTEGFGLVFAEAMYNNCAVVTWQTPVTFELFGGYAVMVPQKDGIIGLVDKMEDLLTHPEYMSEIAGNGRIFVESEYQAQRMSEQYQEAYERSYALFNGTSTSEKVDLIPS